MYNRCSAEGLGRRACASLPHSLRAAAAAATATRLEAQEQLLAALLQSLLARDQLALLADARLETRDVLCGALELVPIESI